MAQSVKLPDPLYERAKEESDRRDITIGAVVDEWHRKSIQWDERNQICPDGTLDLDKLKHECGDE